MPTMRRSSPMRYSASVVSSVRQTIRPGWRADLVIVVLRSGLAAIAADRARHSDSERPRQRREAERGLVALVEQILDHEIRAQMPFEQPIRAAEIDLLI